jgi:hypothetical protein
MPAAVHREPVLQARRTVSHKDFWHPAADENPPFLKIFDSAHAVR